MINDIIETLTITKVKVTTYIKHSSSGRIQKVVREKTINQQIKIDEEELNVQFVLFPKNPENNQINIEKLKK